MAKCIFFLLADYLYLRNVLVHFRITHVYNRMYLIIFRTVMYYSDCTFTAPDDDDDDLQLWQFS